MHRTLALAALTIALLLAATGGTAFADHYNELLAPTSVCPNQTDPSDGVKAQERAMRCMHNQARKKKGLRSFNTVSALMDAAGRKAIDIMDPDCGFSHTACGRDTFHWTRHYGYARGCWGAGENIAWGSGDRGSVRSIMSAWLHSDGHRKNILDRDFRDQGVGLVKGRFEGYPNAQVWVAQLGYRC
jgi:uncharacterized protein YkwD